MLFDSDTGRTACTIYSWLHGTESVAKDELLVLQPVT